jgi:hypothetical protein
VFLALTSFCSLLFASMDVFPLCSATQEHLEDLERKEFLPPKLVSSWHLEEGGSVLAPHDRGCGAGLLL